MHIKAIDETSINMLRGKHGKQKSANDFALRW